MIRVMRPRSGDRDTHHPRTTNSTAFTRRSLGLSNAPFFFSRRSDSGPLDPSAATLTSPSPQITPNNRRTFDPLALVRRLPTRVAAPCYVKSARHLAVFSRFERYWLELRGRLVVMLLHDNIWTSSSSSPHRRSHSATADGPLVDHHPPPKDAVIVAVFTVERCLVLRPRPKTPVLKISNPSHPHHVWLRFDTEADCLAWEKALSAVACQRVVGISDFEFISPIGKGASGKVFLVSDRNTGEKLALKVIDKNKVFENKSSFRHALDERLALEMVDGHPFFSRLRYAFQTRAFFYLAIDFYDGGDLYQYLRTHNGRLKEPQVRAVAAEVILALEHLHELGFVYRDLKPENVLLDSKGHVRLADFGLCKLMSDKPLTNTICGTHTYAAPEMLVRNYGKSVDLWAYGVFVYNILRGRTPYEARDLEQVIANMNLRRIRFSSNTSHELVAMIKKLLDYNPNTRLGCGPGSILEVRGHSFFKGLDWRRVYMRDEELPGLFSTPKKTSGRIGRQSVGSISTSIHTNASAQHETQGRLRTSTSEKGRGGELKDIKNRGVATISNSTSVTQIRSDVGNLTEDNPEVASKELRLNDSSLSSAYATSVPQSSQTKAADEKAFTPFEGHVSVKEIASRMDAMELKETGKISTGSTKSRNKIGGISMHRSSVDRKDSTGWEIGGETAKEPNSSPEYEHVRKGRRIPNEDTPELLQGIERVGSTKSSMVTNAIAVTASSAKKEGSRFNKKKLGKDVSNGTPSLISRGSERGRLSIGRRREPASVEPPNEDVGTKDSVGCGTGSSGRTSLMTGKAISLREQMAAAAEQDDLRNFDMSEWGKISVDNDQDEIGYGDGALWPFARARRKLNEEERMIAGFGYCSCSTPLGLPDHL